jgi:muramoyltetrapeptide carboxypeptidase
MVMAQDLTPLLPIEAISQDAEICVITPASYATAERMQRGLEQLVALGYRPRCTAHAQTRGPLYFAGTQEQRLKDLHAAFNDPDARIVASARGGYGSNYLLAGLDLDLIRRHPKPFLAYSDLTGIQLHLLDALGLPAFHGPMVAADFYLDDGVHLPSLKAALGGIPYAVGRDEGLQTLKAGKARGILYGGCISMLVSLLGTRWEPRTEGKLLFLEDTGVKPYQLDRMLWQLRNAGKFDGIQGIVFGEMLDCASQGASDDLLCHAITQALDGIDVPMAIGLRSGHVSRQNVTLTFGAQAELEVDSDVRLTLLDPVVHP